MKCLNKLTFKLILYSVDYRLDEIIKKSIERIDGKLYVRTNKDLFDFVPKKNNNEESVFEKNNVNELGRDVLKFDDQIITTNNYTIKTTKTFPFRLLPRYSKRKN